jgi:hypothetical protein
MLQRAVVIATVTIEPPFTFPFYPCTAIYFFAFPYLSLDLLQFARTLLKLKIAHKLRRSMRRFGERLGKGAGFGFAEIVWDLWDRLLFFTCSLNVLEDFLGLNPSGLLYQYA